MPHISLQNYLAVGVRGNRAADAAGHRFDWHEGATAIESAHDRIMRAVEVATEEFSVHPERIVLAGYRSGGTMALRIAMRSPGQFAAAVSFGGRMPSGMNVCGDLQGLRKRRLPMLWQWAEDDSCYQPDSLKEDIQLAMMIKAQVDILQYKGDNELNTAALSEFNHWIMSRIVGGVATSSAAADSWTTSPTHFSCN
jgi:phospholipase/carboxylesterase